MRSFAHAKLIQRGIAMCGRDAFAYEETTMTDPIDAALDALLGDLHWRNYDAPVIADWRARMRRVLDAHDARNPNTLPMDALPEGYVFDNLWRGVNSPARTTIWHCLIFFRKKDHRPDHRPHGTGPTPRAAMLAAIEAAKEGKS